MSKRGLFVLVIAALIATGLPFAVSAQEGEEPRAQAQNGPPPSRSFAGCWQAIDEDDDSQQYMWLQMHGRSSLTMMYVDWGASWCGADEDGVLYPAYIWGEGVIIDGTFTPGMGVIVCWADPPYDLVELQLSSATYDPATDTVIDNGLGTVWTRTKMSDCFPTPPRP